MGRIDVLEHYGIPVKPHLEQFERIKRWKKRIDEFRYSNNTEDEINNQLDFIYAFFVNCYHLRDFLTYSRMFPDDKEIIPDDEKIVSNEVVQSFIHSNIEMQICRDICNESKHCFLTNPSIGEIDPETNKKQATGFSGVILRKEYDPFQEILKYDNPIRNIKYIVMANNKNYEVFELADKCVKLWEKFICSSNYFLQRIFPTFPYLSLHFETAITVLTSKSFDTE
jgi:hypothetical protein